MLYYLDQQNHRHRNHLVELDPDALVEVVVVLF